MTANIHVNRLSDNIPFVLPGAALGLFVRVVLILDLASLRQPLALSLFALDVLQKDVHRRTGGRGGGGETQPGSHRAGSASRALRAGRPGPTETAETGQMGSVVTGRGSTVWSARRVNRVIFITMQHCVD